MKSLQFEMHHSIRKWAKMMSCVFAPTFTSAALITQISGFFYSIVLQNIQNIHRYRAAHTPVLQIFSIKRTNGHFFSTTFLSVSVFFLFHYPTPSTITSRFGCLFVQCLHRFLYVCTRDAQIERKRINGRHFSVNFITARRSLSLPFAWRKKIKENFTIQKISNILIRFEQVSHRKCFMNMLSFIFSLCVCFLFFFCIVPLQTFEFFSFGTMAAAASAAATFFSFFLFSYTHILFEHFVFLFIYRVTSNRCNLVASHNTVLSN